MRFGAAVWINRTSWADLLEAARAIERAGWESLWIDDHLLSDEGDPADAKLEGWATLAALAVMTARMARASWSFMAKTASFQPFQWSRIVRPRSR